VYCVKNSLRYALLFLLCIIIIMRPLFVLLLAVIFAANCHAAGDNGSLGRSLYDSAVLLEDSGNRVQAMGEYLSILANYPDDKELAEKSFTRLKTLYDEALKSEDPAFFLVYLENIYNRYKTTGEYDKAIAIIKDLIRIHELPSYYHDLGNIYLYGLNEPASAIPDFERALELQPNNNKVYTDLGLAYELLGDDDKAIVSYRKAELIAPLESWTQYGLKRAEGIELARKGEMIKDWFFIGPFRDNADMTPAEKKIVDEADLAGTYEDNGRVLKWLRPYGYDDRGYVNLSNIFMPQSFARAYALTYIYSPAEQGIQFRLGSDDGVAIWLDGEKVWDNPVKRPASVDNDVVDVTLKEGWNTLLVKVSQDWGGWGFYFRVTEMDGKPVENIIFDPLKDEKRTEAIKKAFEEEKRAEMARVILKYGLSGALVLLLAALVIANAVSTVRINRMRREFVSSITHDLKVPLAAIMASAEMLIDGKVKSPEKISEYHKAIAGEAERLNGYIYKILDFSRKGRRKPYDLKEMDIKPVVEKAVAIYRNESPSENLSLDLIAEGVVPRVNIDEEAFTQVVVNLLSNADKYSRDDKRIELRLFGDGGKAVLTVKDHGIGIAPKHLKKIFKKFYRVNDKAVRDKRGIGLGLAFVKNIVEVHKGRISVESVPGEGSTFRVELPRA